MTSTKKSRLRRRCGPETAFWKVLPAPPSESAARSYKAQIDPAAPGTSQLAGNDVRVQCSAASRNREGKLLEGGPLLPIEPDELAGIRANRTRRRRFGGRGELRAARQANEGRAHLEAGL